MKFIRSFGFAWNGLKICFASETNFRIHILACVVSILLGLGFAISAVEWLAVFLCIVIVITMEMMNTAVEKLCNVVKQEIHPGIKTVKDISAGAVLIAAVLSCVTGLVIFIPKIINFLNHH